MRDETFFNNANYWGRGQKAAKNTILCETSRRVIISIIRVSRLTVGVRLEFNSVSPKNVHLYVVFK